MDNVLDSTPYGSADSIPVSASDVLAEIISYFEV